VNVARKCGLTAGEETMLVDCKAGRDLSGIVVHHDTMERERKLDWNDVLANVGDYDVAMTGNAFSNLVTTKNGDFVNTLLRYTNVFARTSPIQKTQIVMTLKDGTKNTVGMVGDGANDCGALKAADCGLSISDGEAAIAAPFSAATISSVIDLLLEGRGALATSFSLFKFMILYSIIQTSQVMCAYVFLNLLADTQFLYNDLGLILPLSFTMGLAEPTNKLVPMRPPATLFMPSVLFSVIGHSMFMICFYISVVYFSQVQIWVNPSNQPVTLVNGTTPFISVAVSCIWLVGNMLYWAYAFAFSIGHPFRQKFYQNHLLLLALIVVLTLNILWFWVQTSGVLSFWQLVQMPYDFIGKLFAITIGFMVFTYIYEWIIIRFVADKEAKMRD
jgi:cation-transporting ATPase 13A3/4/5